MNGRTLKVGTRGSRLALWQADHVRSRLSVASERVLIKTDGDLFQERPLGESDTVGFFTKEIEERLRDGSIDLAVHSLKDLPTQLAAGLAIGAFLRRHDPGDVLLVRPDACEPGRSVPVARGARIGASSLRRQAFLGLYAPQASAVPVRGNVPTRVDKVRGGEYEGIVLARAGLARLQLDVAPLVAFDLNPRRWICAPGQGVIALEMRADDDVVAGEAARLDDEATRLAAGLEREQLVLFGGGCHAPLGAFAHQCGQDAWELLVAAPGACGFVVTRFGSGELETVRSEAAAWQAAGRPARKSARQEEEWVSRPAQPWC